MKRLFILAFLTLFAMSVSAQQRIDLRNTSKAEITKSEFTNLRAVFSYGAIESIEINTEKGVFSEIAIEGTYVSGEIGTPELPASHQLLAVPFGATPSVNVISYTTTDYKLSDYGIKTILPHQPSVSKDQRPEDIKFVYDATAYQTRGLSNEPTTTFEVQGTMRGIRIGSLVVNPVSYDPTSNTLRVFNDIEVEINFEGADRAETERMLLNTYSPYFDIVYKQMFNYRQILDVYTDHPDLMAYPVHMIVIAPESYLSALEPWVNWKIQKGFDVNVYTTSQIGSNYNAIRSFVQNQYNTGVSQGNTPTFLVLVGDVAQIPATTGSQSQSVTDLYYGSVDNDYFPDIFYSRMSAENTSQLTSIINKILQYEQYTMTDPSYLNNALLIAGQDDYWNPRVAQPTINYATTYYYNTAHGFSNVYAYLNSYSGCYNNLNTGVGFANYTAHGSETGWSGPSFSNSNVNSLSNTNKYFLAMGNCCLTGNFGYSSPCFGEAMIRATNKGAYSYIGSCPVTYWYEDFYFGVGAHNTHGGPTPTFQGSSTGCYDGIWMDETYNTVSSMVFLGNLAVCYAHTGSYQTHSNPTYYWQAYHVLGDGSIMPYRVNPTANNVSHATTFPAGSSSFTVNAEAGSYVGISQNNTLIGAALVPAAGTVNVPVSAVGPGQVRIVVTKPQRQPYIQDINVGGGGGTTYAISVEANPTEGGTISGAGYYNQGQSCMVIATANSNYSFVNWTENGNEVSTDASYTFTVTGNRTLVANFSTQYTVSIAANPANGGSVAFGNKGVRDEVNYDFEDGSLQGWTSIDADGDSYGWGVGSESFGSTGLGHNASTDMVVSASYINNVGALTPDNYLVSPAKAEYTGITFYACGQDASYAAEHFGVAVSTTTATASAFTMVQEWTLTAKGGGQPTNATRSGNRTQGNWYQYTVDLSAYAGQEIWVAIRHFNVTDMFFLDVDDITLSGDGSTPPTPPTTGDTYDFDDGSLQGWTSIDADGDLYGWGAGSESFGSTGLGHNASTDMVVSASYINNVGALTPDNYLVSPTKAQYTGITFYACGQDASYAAEHFGVAVSTTTATASAFTMVQEWTLTAKGGGQPTNATRSGNRAQGNWYQYTVDLSAYAGQEIWVAIRHFNVTDMFFLDVDDITLTTGSGTGGDPNSATFNLGESCTVIATPNTDFNFVGWSENGNIVSTNATYTFPVIGDRTLVANFSTSQTQQYTVSIAANPANGGSVAFANKNGRDDVTYDFDNGTMQGWSSIDADGDGYGWGFGSESFGSTGLGHNASTDMVVSASYVNNVGALTPDNYLVSPNKASYSSISFYACGQDASYAAEHFGVAVSTTTATASAFTMVQEWTMTAKGGGQPTNATRSGNRTQGNWYQYTVDLSAYAGQEIWVAIRHFNCYDMFFLDVDDITLTTGSGTGGDPSSAIFNLGESCTVIATPNTDFNFVGWSENGNIVSTNATYTFTVTGNRTLVANFSTSQTQQYTVSIAANPANGGSVAFGNKDGRDEVNYDFDDGSLQGWTSIDADGDSYGWGAGSESFGSTGLGHNASTDMVVSASYINNVGALMPDNYLVSPAKAEYTGITFYACGQDASYAAEHFGVAVSTTTATASAFTMVQEWTLTAKGGGQPTNATRSGNRTQGNWYQYTVDLSAYAGQEIWVAIRHFNVTDMFFLDVDDITLTSGSGGPGIGEPIIAIFNEGESCTVTATPNNDFYFVGWTENGDVVSTDATYTFTVTENRILVANFENMVGVDETLSQNLVVYPNPTTGLIKMNGNGIKEVKVYNTLGMLIMSLNTNGNDSVEIDLSGLPNGVYFLQASNEIHSVTKQVMKME